MTTAPMHLLEDLNTHLFLQSAQNIALVPVCIEVFPFFSPVSVNDGQTWLEKDIIPLLSLPFMIFSSHLPKRKKLTKYKLLFQLVCFLLSVQQVLFNSNYCLCPGYIFFFFIYNNTFNPMDTLAVQRLSLSPFISYSRNG